MDTNILLESGTNELEVLEFKLGNSYYGINVAKIREIIPYQPVTMVPNAHPSIEGIFRIKYFKHIKDNLIGHKLSFFNKSFCSFTELGFVSYFVSYHRTS